VNFKIKFIKSGFSVCGLQQPAELQESESRSWRGTLFHRCGHGNNECMIDRQDLR